MNKKDKTTMITGIRLILSIALLITVVSLFLIAFSNYQATKSTYDSLSEIDRIHMQQQKEYWQDRALISYVKEWPSFIVEFNNKTGLLTTESGGDGNVTIMVDHPNVTIDSSFLEYVGNQTWRYYAHSGVWFCVTLSYPTNISFNITVVKDIERFYNPYSNIEDDWWEFPSVEKTIEVKT